MKFGENVKNEQKADFGQAFAELIKYCLKYIQDVIIA